MITHKEGEFWGQVSAWSITTNRAGEPCLCLEVALPDGKIAHFAEFSDVPVGSTTRARLAVELLRKVGFEGNSLDQLEATPVPQGWLRVKVTHKNGYSNMVVLGAGSMSATKEEQQALGKRYNDLLGKARVKSAVVDSIPEGATQARASDDPNAAPF